MTDLELIDRIRQGDLVAFRTMVERNKLAVYRLAYDMTGNRHDAEDISQEVFLRAFRSIGKFRGDARLSSWLYRITVNVCNDHRSKKSWSAMKADERLEERMADPLFHGNSNNNPETVTEGKLIQYHIEQALQALTPRERSVFVLRHYHDLSLKEIAEVLKISEGTVKSMLFRALKRLQKELRFYRQDFGMEKIS